MFAGGHIFSCEITEIGQCVKNIFRRTDFQIHLLQVFAVFGAWNSCYIYAASVITNTKTAMTTSDFIDLYGRELDNLHKEIAAYSDESKLWEISGEIKNPPGNLCLHLLGNVNHFIGAILGKNGYVRERDKEFTLKGVPREKLLDDIRATRTMMVKVLSDISAEELKKDFPVELVGKHSTEYMLSFFLGHFMYHLGQINYHRRLQNAG